MRVRAGRNVIEKILICARLSKPGTRSRAASHGDSMKYFTVPASSFSSVPPINYANAASLATARRSARLMVTDNPRRGRRRPYGIRSRVCVTAFYSGRLPRCSLADVFARAPRHCDADLKPEIGVERVGRLDLTLLERINYRREFKCSARFAFRFVKVPAARFRF